MFIYNCAINYHCSTYDDDDEDGAWDTFPSRAPSMFFFLSFTNVYLQINRLLQVWPSPQPLPESTITHSNAGHVWQLPPL